MNWWMILIVPIGAMFLLGVSFLLLALLVKTTSKRRKKRAGGEVETTPPPTPTTPATTTPKKSKVVPRSLVWTKFVMLTLVVIMATLSFITIGTAVVFQKQNPDINVFREIANLQEGKRVLWYTIKPKEMVEVEIPSGMDFGCTSDDSFRMELSNGKTGPDKDTDMVTFSSKDESYHFRRSTIGRWEKIYLSVAPNQKEDIKVKVTFTPMSSDK